MGFDAIGVTNPAAIAAAGARLHAFIAAGRHGDMGWLAERADERAAPNALWPAARSAIVLALNYGPRDDPMAATQRPAHGAISVYAKGGDYHDVIKRRLKALARDWVAQHGGAVKVFVDTAPLMEKPLAAAAGLGWQGKHTNLVSREFGSYLFLGVILTDQDIAADAAETDHCGVCSACLDACPTAAFPAPYQLDARRCISYLTIEHRGHIAAEFRAAMGNRIYGCDDCLAVCPWNKFARAGREAALWARAELQAPELRDLVELDDPGFRAVFAGSPIKRTGRDRLVRNVLIAIGNSGDGALAAAAQRRLQDASPLVRAMAVWALGRLDPARAKQAAGRRETDPAVQAEWAALSEP